MERTNAHLRPLGRRGTADAAGELQIAYLSCLARLARIRFRQASGLNEQGILLLDRAIFAAFCECRDAGVAREALALLEELRQDAASAWEGREAA
ncbi:MAG TPA: hypothetical protein VIO14_07355 [Dehalococcoidia bacterium]